MLEQKQERGSTRKTGEEKDKQEEGEEMGRKHTEKRGGEKEKQVRGREIKNKRGREREEETLLNLSLFSLEPTHHT